MKKFVLIGCLVGWGLIRSLSAATIFVEAEQFAEKGGWVVDSQFIDLMGSSFLLAHGLGKPVADASCEVQLPEAGSYTLFARTRNWTAHWSPHAAGTFQILVNGQAHNGAVLGKGSAEWQWQKALTCSFAKNERVRLSLHDLTGFDGRCDALCLTTESVPPTQARLVPSRTSRTYDLVVCGGGIAGICAAISAARLGLSVALVQDRPILGGANSSEVRVHLGGHLNVGPYPRLGDIVREIGPAQGGNAREGARYEDQRKLEVVQREKNLSLFLNHRVLAATKKGNRITTVMARHVIENTELILSAPLFVDCTGDACLGALVGAAYRMGRESKAETGEEMAVDTPDKLTMGASVQWYSEAKASPVSFPNAPWMIAFNEQNCEHNFRGDWDWETGMLRNQVTEFERIRDYGLLVAYSNWSYLKNQSARQSRYANRALTWVAYVAGKRESRRLMGDHILTQQDVFEEKPYPDASFATTWPIDLHTPMPKNTKHYPGEPFRSVCTHAQHYAYAVPYRCLYSRNISNLFMAGRNISVTHVALGTVRVMRTTGMMGEVVGMAACICKTHSCTPREVYQKYLNELKDLMTRGIGKEGPHPPQNYNMGGLKVKPDVSLSVRPRPDENGPLEPSIQNEVEHACDLARAWLSTAPTPSTNAPTGDILGTNGLSRARCALRLVSLQRQGGWWLTPTNAVPTQHALQILTSLLHASPTDSILTH